MLVKIFSAICIFICFSQSAYCLDQKSEAKNIHKLPNYQFNISQNSFKKLNYIKQISDKNIKNDDIYSLKYVKQS